MIKLYFQRMRERQSRRLFFGLLSAKLGAAALVLGVAIFGQDLLGRAAGAATGAAAPVKIADTVSAINTTWVLVAAFLVFFMQAGFMMLEAGFARQRETVNVLLECIVDTCLCGLLFYAIGFAFMFGQGNGLIGHEFFFLQNVPATYSFGPGLDTGVAFFAFFLFQLAFADTCSTITSGAMVGRTGFVGDLLYSVGVSAFIYPILGHWVWGPGGWLGNMGSAGHVLPDLGVAFKDFAGSTVVHTVGAMIALAGAIALGPRLGRKFKRDGGGMPPGHDLTIAAIGGIILWFGWYGFNPGSTLSAMDFEGIGRVATNTTLAASAAGLASMFFVFPRLKKWDMGITINGFLAGLVAITASCYWVSPTGSIIIGALAGVVMVLAVDFVEHLRIDDPIGAVAVHGACGIFGTLALGLFATGDYGVDGLFYGGGWRQLGAQAIGSAVITCVSLAAGLALMYLVKATGTLRVSEEGEMEGLDYHEHGGEAYHPEFGGPGGYVDLTTLTTKAPVEV